MAQHLRALTVVLEDPGFPTPSWWITTVYNSTSRRPHPLLPPQDSLGTRHTYAQQAHIQVKHTAICKIRSTQSIRPFPALQAELTAPSFGPSTTLLVMALSNLTTEETVYVDLPLTTASKLNTIPGMETFPLLYLPDSNTSQQHPAKQKATRNLPMTVQCYRFNDDCNIIVSIYSSL